MGDEQSNSSSDIRNFTGDVVDNISYLFNLTSFCEADLNTKLTLKTPGRTYTKLRSFKFNFQYLFTLSSRQDEIEEPLKNNIRTWLEMEVTFEKNGDIKLDYIRAGLKLFSMYADELKRAGLITYKR